MDSSAGLLSEGHDAQPREWPWASPPPMTPVPPRTGPVSPAPSHLAALPSPKASDAAMPSEINAEPKEAKASEATGAAMGSVADAAYYRFPGYDIFAGSLLCVTKLGRLYLLCYPRIRRYCKSKKASAEIQQMFKTPEGSV